LAQVENNKRAHLTSGPYHLLSGKKSTKRVCLSGMMPPMPPEKTVEGHLAEAGLFGRKMVPLGTSVEILDISETDDRIEITTKHTLLKKRRLSAEPEPAPLPGRVVIETVPAPATNSIISPLTIKRHVYHARGGAPPHRGDYLTATDSIELQSNKVLSDQITLMVPPDGMGGMFGGATLYLLPAGQAAPMKDPALFGSPHQQPDMSKTAHEVFGHPAGYDLIVCIPMKGMD